MDFVDEYRNPRIIEQLVDQIRPLAQRPIRLMEVCGTHTVSIFRNGIKDLLPEDIRLISGPGCPVCVTPVGQIDQAIALAQENEVILATFGDLLRVPGSNSSLLQQRGQGADIRMVYSAYDALTLAQENPKRQVIFLGIGFETTAPTVGAVVQHAMDAQIRNFTVLCMHKILPPALTALVESPEIEIDGFICPGHVSTIIGAGPYEVIAKEFHVPCVIAGFEPIDILQTVGLLLHQINKGEANVEIQYRRAVAPEGNLRAKKIMEEVFEPCDSVWRGFGSLPQSGFAISSFYRDYDASHRFQMCPPLAEEPEGCLCGSILRGLVEPPECTLFRRVCTPENPVGACMVSSEGTCAAFYKYAY
jgi:hydrogenase expression/formation protein HypD